jgi:hypothetical protein
MTDDPAYAIPMSEVPPSSVSTCPTSASFSAMNTAACATSSGLTKRPIDVARAQAATTSGGAPAQAGVSV